jgi:serine/threonine protein kinase
MTTSSKKSPGGGDGGYLGRILDERYRLDEVIGAGAIGKVYAGTQLAVDRKVAIKLLHPAIRDRELGKERFLREAKAVARLSHSSCLTLFDFGSDDELGCFYMVTEFVDGTTLANEMQQGELPVERSYHVLYHAATALQHAHERGILHRDLKPENIMLVGEDGVYSSVKVLDFGLARIREGARHGTGLSDISEPGEDGSSQAESGAKERPDPFGDSRLTNFGELNGTPAYMSPEQCRGDLNLTQACDYYSLGVLAFELIEGRLPYESSVVQRLLAMHLNDPIPKMTSGRAPEEIQDMVYRLLAKDPAHRLQSANEVLDTLRPYITVDPSREMSRATLERYRRDSPPKGQQTATPVSESGAETLANYGDVDTPVPMAATAVAGSPPSDDLSRDSAFGTMLAADQSAGDDQTAVSKARGPAVALVAGVLVLFVGVGAWWVSSTPDSEPVSLEEVRAEGQEQASEDSSEEQSLTGAVESQEEASAAAAAEVSPGADVDEKDQAPNDEAPPTTAAAESEGAKEVRPEPPTQPKAEGAKEHKRPRKLELTY